MTPSDATDAIIQEGIEELDVNEVRLLSRETEWHISDNHRQTLSFSDVYPADIIVRNLGVQVDIAASFVDAFKARFTKSKVGDLEGHNALGGVRRKKILNGVSANFSPGTLTAIIGGSGSGKVHLYPRASYAMLNSSFTLPPP